MRMCACLLSALAIPVDAVARTYVVVIEQMRFEPGVLTVERGDRIQFVNKDLFPHTATADKKTFDSHAIAPGASWSLVVRHADRYTYFCTLHPTMHAILIVQ
ncbi:cupredoxin family copper-binding protein [Caballeronia sp. LZ035]|nr:cupredoxin family copper-binding protein [Caballeronia sp. LZ035]MDR5759471.1 cupredoxin family copper-binding protein [Caballeronia sp. LZ035]